MIAPGFAGVEAQLWVWLVAMIRPGAAFIAAPVFGAPAVPLQLRLILALALGLAALNTVTITLPQDGIASFEGVMMVAGEVMAGLAIGFAVQIGYAAAFVAGEAIGNAMGLNLSLIHISEPTRLGMISYAVFCLKKKNTHLRAHETRGNLVCRLLLEKKKKKKKKYMLCAV